VDKVERPLVDDVERPLVDDVERPLVDDVERPLVDDVERLLVDKVERPLVDKVERPLVDKVERPLVDDVELLCFSRVVTWLPFLVECERPRMERFVDEEHACLSFLALTVCSNMFSNGRYNASRLCATLSCAGNTTDNSICLHAIGRKDDCSCARSE